MTYDGMAIRLGKPLAAGLGVLLSLSWLASASADLSFQVRFDKSVRADAATGRLVVYLIREGADVGNREPADGPFFEDPQPMFAIDVKDLAPGVAAEVEAGATAFPVNLNELPAGSYRVQAVLDLARLNSSWKREAGNLSSKVIPVVVSADRASNKPVEIELTEAAIASANTLAKGDGVEPFEIRSQLLSAFRGYEVMLRAGVVLPVDYDPKRQYAAVYEVPGFGGDHSSAASTARMFKRVPATQPAGQLARNVFWIVLDSEGPNGHHLFANSANNGPVGDALVRELIPALEKKYNLIAQPSARLLRGHSSGGWSTLWLATQYPETFGATWSSSPDPVDFRRFQLIDVYKAMNAYFEKPRSGGPLEPTPTASNKDKPLPSYRSGGKELMTILEENRMEEVLGPDNTSGQQWDSWFAAFGPRSDRGTPAPLWDASTGVIDHVVAESFRKYDLAELLRKNPAKYGPIFKQRVRLIVGDADNYYLNEAVALLKPEVEKLNFIDLPEGPDGYIKIVQGKDHGSIYATKEMQSIPLEMLEHLKRSKHTAE